MKTRNEQLIPLKTALTVFALFGALALTSAQSIPNPSFETNSFTTWPGYWYETHGNGAIVGWSTDGTTSLNPVSGSTDHNPFADNGIVPDGSNVAFIQSGTNSFLATTVSNLTAGQTYKVNFRVNARAAGGAIPNLKVLIGSMGLSPSNIVYATIAPVGGSNPYHYFAFDFTATGDTNGLILLNDATNTDNTVLVDDFSIVPRNSGWSYAPWNGDASSGVVGNPTNYTHAYNFGTSSNAIITGLTFTGIPGGNPSNSMFSTTGLPGVANGDSNNVTGTSAALARDSVYGGAVESLTLNGLVVGNSYLATIYSVGYDTNGARAATFSVGNDRLTVNQDQFGYHNGIRVSYAYTAYAQSLTISNAALQGGGQSFYISGFSNAQLTNGHPAFLIVTNLADSGPGTLRQVIANTEPGDTITFATNGTMTLTSGSLLITNNLNIAGPGPASLAVDGNLAYRVFNVGAGVTSSISGLTIQNGRLQNGGGLGNFGTMVLSNCVITGNAANGASGFGGAIHNGTSGALTLFACTVSNNRAGDGAAGPDGTAGAFGHPNGTDGSPGGTGGNGGGIYNEGVLGITACTINNNTVGSGGSGGNGGAAYDPTGYAGNGASGGTGGAGGGVFNAPAATLGMTNCTLWGNSTGNGGSGGNSGTTAIGVHAGNGGNGGNSGDGGGIYNASSGGGQVVLACTVTANATGVPAPGGSGASNGNPGNPGRGGGIKNDGSLALDNTIVAPNELYSPGSFSGAYNLTTNFNGTPVDPLLAPPHNYGGLTLTMPPLPGSPAIDVGDDSLTNFLVLEQRGPGYPRKVGPHVDIGATAYNNSPVVTTLADSGLGSLRNAVVFSPDFTTITFDPALSGMTNVLTSGQLTIYTRLPAIDASALPGGFKISGNRNSRVFELDTDTPVTLNSLTIQDGYVFNANGGGILANTGAHLTLTNCTLSRNSAGGTGGNGGGLYIEEGTLTVAGCQFSANSTRDAASGGGAAICASGGTLTINGSTLSSNSAAYNGGGILLTNSAVLTINGSALSSNSATNNGGGIYLVDNCTLTINNSTVSSDWAPSGGGIYLNEGSELTLNDSTVLTNSAPGRGGGIYLNEGSQLTLNDSTVSGNVAHGAGGIFNVTSSLVANNCTLSGNSAGFGFGGAIYNVGGAGTTSVLNNCTLSGNSADTGGAIESQGMASTVLNSCTLSGNSAATIAGGIDNLGTLALTNTIVAGNTGPPPADIVIEGGSFDAAFSLTNGNPLLAQLGNYGGTTQTMPPLAGSPAIDAGNDSAASAFLTDQRGFPRLSGAHVDIGAIETQSAPAGNPPLLLAGSARSSGGMFSFSFGFTNAPIADFTVLVSTNVALPLRQWTILGAASQSQPGHYQFTDSNATNYPRRFYKVTSP
jgi:hypothetical protein